MMLLVDLQAVNLSLTESEAWRPGWVGDRVVWWLRSEWSKSTDLFWNDTDLPAVSN